MVETHNCFNRVRNKHCVPVNTSNRHLYNGMSDGVLFGIPHKVNDPEIEKLTQDSLDLWNKKGKLVMISHNKAYIQGPDIIHTETSPLMECDTLNAEKKVLDAGGIVLRLAGANNFHL